MGKWSADQGEQRKHTDVMRGKGEGVRAKRVSGVGVRIKRGRGLQAPPWPAWKDGKDMALWLVNMAKGYSC